MVQRKDVVLESFIHQTRAYHAAIHAMYLFGSRARGDEHPDSDYDILIVTKKKDLQLKDKIYDIVTDISLETRRDISLKFFTHEEFDRLKSIPSRFIHEVVSEGVKIG